MKLVNSSMSQLFAIPQTTWAQINQRVEFVLNLSRHRKIQVPWPSEQNWNKLQNLHNDSPMVLDVYSLNSNKVPVNGKIYEHCTWCIGTNTPTVMTECVDWAAGDFHNLVRLANEVASYAHRAGSKCEELFFSINPRNSQMTPGMRNMAGDMLQGLFENTMLINGDLQSVLTKMKGFLSSHERFNQFFITNSFLIPMINLPQIQLSAFNDFDSSIEAVLGAWNALSNDFSGMTSENINITLPFLMSLDLKSAMIAWGNIEKEASSFAQSAAEQEKRWQDCGYAYSRNPQPIKFVK